MNQLFHKMIKPEDIVYSLDGFILKIENLMLLLLFSHVKNNLMMVYKGNILDVIIAGDTII